MRRFFLIVALALSATVSLGLGVGWAAFRTEAGRDALTSYLGAALDGAVNGEVQIGSIGGSLIEGLVIEDLVIRDTAGVLLVRIPRLVARYRIADLVSRRIVLGQLIITDPHINILKRTSEGPFNFQDVMGAGGNGNGGTPPLIAFEDVEVHRATIVIRTPTDPPRPDQRHVVEETEWGLLRTRRIDSLSIRLDYARLSSPGDPGLRFDVRDLVGDFSDPGLDIRGLSGRIDLDGDSLHLDVKNLQLPGSNVAAYGFLKWPTGKLELGLNVDADALTINDLHTFSTRLPWGMAGSGRARMFSPNPDSLSILIDPVRLGASGGRLTGKVGFTISGGKVVEFRDTELLLDSVDLDHVRPLLDTLPFDGRLSGTLNVNGPTNLVSAGIDWTFLDGTVDGWPLSYISGNGIVALGDPGTTLLNFQVDTARIDLKTLRELFPSVQLRGFVGGSVDITGFWRNAELIGRFWHEPDSLAVSRASGSLRFDSRLPTLAVFAELGLDSLHFPSMRPSYPLLPPAGAVTGQVSMAGFIDSLPITARLQGAGGDVLVGGVFSATPELVSFDDLGADFNDLNLATYYPGFFPTELFGSVVGGATIDSAGLTESAFSISYDESFVAGSPLDSGTSRVSIRDSVFRTTSEIWGPGLVATADGGLGWGPSRSDSLMVVARADSIGSISSLIEFFAPRAAEDSLLSNLVGRGQMSATLIGSRSDFAATLSLAIPEAYSDGGAAEGFFASAQWSTEYQDPIHVTGSVDSLAIGKYAFSDLGIELNGTKARSDWFARARLGLDGSVVGWGKSFADGRVLVLPLDSLALLLNQNVWMLNHPAVVSVSDSGFLFSQFTLESDKDPRSPNALSCPDRRPSLTLEGLFPTNGSAELTADLVAIPVPDIWGIVQLNPARTGGDVCGRIQLGGTASAPLVASGLSVRGGRIGSVNIPLMTGQVDYRDQRLNGAFEFTDDGELLTEVNFDLPLDLALREVAERRVAGPLSVSVRADSLDLKIVELITETVTDAGGTFYGDFGIRGSWEEPVLTGTGSVVAATARYPRLGVTHSRVTGGVHLNGDSILIDSLVAFSGDGLVSTTGSVRLDGMRRPLLDLRFDAAEFHTANIAGLVDLTTSGTVDLRGPILGATLTGSGTVTEGTLFFADLVEKEIINLEDTLYAELLDEELQALIQREGLGANFQNRFLDSLHIEGLQLEMGRSMWLRSSQANVQLEGGLTVDKSGDVYRYDGTLNTPRGTYRLPYLASTDFSVTDGEVVYFGTSDLNAALDINAQHLVRTVRAGDNIQVFVNIGGTLDNPIVGLTADREPALPISEIISYLLVGTPRVESSFFRSTDNQRTSSAVGTALNAVVGQVSSQVERALISDLGVPVDYLRVRWEGTGGAELTFGRRLGDRWFLIANPSVCFGSGTDAARQNLGSGRVEYRFSDAWSWSVSRDPGSTCRGLVGLQSIDQYQWGVDLFWQRRY